MSIGGALGATAAAYVTVKLIGDERKRYEKSRKKRRGPYKKGGKK